MLRRRSSVVPPLFLGLLLAAVPLGTAREISIPLEQTEIDGAALGVQPGDVILLEAGRRQFLKIDRVVGSPQACVTIRNHGGLVTIANSDRYYGIFVGRSRHFRITGTGSADFVHGIHIGGTGPHGSGLMIAGLSSDYELDHLHIARAGFAGMLLKTDGADGTLLAHVNLHHNYIHDTGGEGLYLGETQPTGQTLRHVEIWNNVVARTGWEACQIAHGAEDVRVHHNVFYRAGLTGELWQDNNFQLSANTTCEFHHNLVIGAGSHLVIAFGGLTKAVHDNYFEGTRTGPAVSLADSNIAAIANTTFTLENNFFRGVQPVQPIVLFTGEKTVLRARGNRWEGSNRFIRFQPVIDLSQSVRLDRNENTAVARPRFVDEARDNFRLVPGDPYQKLGFGLLPQ